MCGYALDILNFHSLNRGIGDLKNQLVNAVRISALLYEKIFQFNKAMYNYLPFVAIQICVIGFVFHNATVLS